MGEYIHSIDAKGRVIVPSKFRELLGDHFIVTVGLDGCLWVFSDEEWEEFSSKLRSLPVANETARKFARHFLSGADEAEPDKQGRILIPQKLRNFAKLEKDVVAAEIDVGKLFAGLAVEQNLDLLFVTLMAFARSAALKQWEYSMFSGA